MTTPSGPSIFIDGKTLWSFCVRRVESTVERRVMEFEETLVVVSYEEEGKLEPLSLIRCQT